MLALIFSNRSNKNLLKYYWKQFCSYNVIICYVIAAKRSQIVSIFDNVIGYNVITWSKCPSPKEENNFCMYYVKRWYVIFW